MFGIILYKEYIPYTRTRTHAHTYAHTHRIKIYLCYITHLRFLNIISICSAIFLFQIVDIQTKINSSLNDLIYLRDIIYL